MRKKKGERRKETGDRRQDIRENALWPEKEKRESRGYIYKKSTFNLF